MGGREKFFLLSNRLKMGKNGVFDSLNGDFGVKKQPQNWLCAKKSLLLLIKICAKQWAVFSRSCRCSKRGLARLESGVVNGEIGAQS